MEVACYSVSFHACYFTHLKTIWKIRNIVIRMFMEKCGCQTAFLAETAARDKQNILKGTSNYHLNYVQREKNSLLWKL